MRSHRLRMCSTLGHAQVSICTLTQLSESLLLGPLSVMSTVALPLCCRLGFVLGQLRVKSQRQSPITTRNEPRTNERASVDQRKGATHAAHGRGGRNRWGT